MKKTNYKKEVLQKRVYGGSEYVKIAVLAIDFLLLNLLFAALIWLDKDLVPQYFTKYTKMSVLVMNFTMVIAELYYHTIVQRRLVGTLEIARNCMKLVLTQSVLMYVLLRLLNNSGGFFRYMLIFAGALYAVIIVSRFIERWTLNKLRAHGRNTQTVLFVGHDPALVELYNSLTESASVGYRILGYYSIQKIKNCPEGLEYLGDVEDLKARLDQWDENPTIEKGINEVFCSIPHDEAGLVQRIMHSCDKSVIRFFYVPRIFEDQELNLKMQHFGNYTLFTNYVEPLVRPSNRALKRAFDILFSLLVCIFLIPITLIVGIIIKLQSPGPIFFKQDRTGIDGSTFKCIKFRSMHVNKDADNVQATKDDPRKFPFGNFMRKTNIDELPQFFNVLIGDMSIVGPRPHMLHHTEMYGKLIDKYMVRHFCRPGITGWAQVTGFRGETHELWQMEQRVKKDIWYIEHWSFWLDIKIIFMTAKSIFIHDENAY
ncbi:MAG: undecaprenyl-phosphate glucose phosphotransferase [Prevotella sp.]|jgi:putative colanic acid biosynthesis UDP-glucose lipid carrier transferase